MFKIIVCTGEYAELAQKSFVTAHNCIFPERRGIQRAMDEVAHWIYLSMKSKQTLDLKIVTYSDATLNLLGNMIEMGVLAKEHVEILLYISVEPTKHYFDDHGQIATNWPYGCLMPDMYACIDYIKEMLKRD